MKLRDRLRTLAESLPRNASVVLTRENLEELLADEPEPMGSGTAPDAVDLTVAQVAERFGRKPQTVRDWIKLGKLGAYLFNGREYRITSAALAQFEEQQRGGSTPRPPRGARTRDKLGAWRKVTAS